MELFSPPVCQRYPILKMSEPGGWIDSHLSAAMIILEGQDPGEQDLPGCRSGGADIFPMIAKTPLSKEHGLLISRPSFG